MKNVYFKPFIGENYENSKQKIMMLVEFHYLYEEDQTSENRHEWGRDLTNKVLKGTDNSQKQSFFCLYLYR